MRSLANLVVVLPLLVAARPLVATDIDDVVRQEIERQHIPGAAVAVVKEGKIVEAKGFGLANIELDVPASPESVFKIGSVSKQFIAAGVLLLMQDGKLALDDKISSYLKDTPEAWKDITIRHLLTHTSGIVREGPAYSPLKEQSDAAVVKSAYPLPLRFTPGEKFQYCNVGYFALAEIVHTVSGKPWPAFLEERIFKPLEMTSTRATTFKDLVPHRAGGYVWMGKKYQNASAQLAVRPSGALLSSVLDLAKWDAALYGDQIFHSATKEAMWTPARLNDGSTSDYGFGWDLAEVNGHRLIHHGGSLAGFRSELARLVDDKLTVIVLTNADGASPAIIANKVAALYIPELAPKKREPVGAAQ